LSQTSENPEDLRQASQRERIEQLTIELADLDAQIKPADRAKKRRPRRGKSQK
jgi:hypothetical protein